MSENVSGGGGFHHTERAVLTAAIAANPAWAERKIGRPIRTTLAPAAAKVVTSSSVSPPSGPMMMATFVTPGTTI